MMNTSDWRFGIAANIVRQHLDAEGILRFGTKEFVGGTKVYLDGKNFFNYERTEIVVIGLNRFHRYEIAAVSPEHLENIRFQVIRKPGVLKIIDYEEAMEGWHWYGRTAEDKREAMRFVAQWELHKSEMLKRLEGQA